MDSVLILGATSDISEALAYKYAQNKCNLILASRNENRLSPLKSDIEIKHDINVSLVEFDALDFDSHKQFYEDLEIKPSIVICMFGYLGEQKKSESNFLEAKKVIESNYLGALSILNIISNEFEKNKEGVLVGISSVAGDRGRESNYIYGSAKAGFTTYLSGLRNRLSKFGVHVLTVKPGFVNTQMTKDLDLPKLLTAMPEDVANDVFKAVKKKKNVLYTKWFWKYIMLIIKNIPESIFKKLSL